jgi:hypothetical protein
MVIVATVSCMDSSAHDKIHTSPHARIHANIHTTVHTNTCTNIHANTDSSIHANTHANMHCCPHANNHNSVHANMHCCLSPHANTYANTHTSVHANNHTSIIHASVHTPECVCSVFSGVGVSDHEGSCPWGACPWGVTVNGVRYSLRRHERVWGVVAAEHRLQVQQGNLVRVLWVMVVVDVVLDEAMDKGV